MATPLPPPPPGSKMGVLLRVGVFGLIAILGYFIFPLIILFAIGRVPLVVAALGSFAAASVANAIALRIWERGRLSDIGLDWTAGSGRNLSLGLLGGIGAGLIVLVGPILARVADLEPAPDSHTHWPSIIFVSIILVFGAVGEEMLFRGYAFQVLVRAMGAYATILPVGILFGLAHSDNPNFTWVALVNTTAWGILFGYAFLRSGDLWLPIGLHFGWNWVLPLLGVNLSGFTMRITGYSLRWRIGDLWSGGDYGPEGGLLTSIVVVALFVYLHRAPIQQQRAFLLQDVP